MSPNIHSIQTGMSCSYLIEGADGLILVDAGGPGAESIILRKMRTLGHADLRLIFLTHAHFDHYGGAAALRRATGAPVAIHQADAKALAEGRTEIGSARGLGKLLSLFLPLAMHLLRPNGITADEQLADGDDLRDFGLGAVLVHTPGHTPGSSSLLVENRFAFVGDLVTAAPSAHAQNYFAQDWGQLGESVRRVQKLRPQWVFGGHGCKAFSGDILDGMA